MLIPDEFKAKCESEGTVPWTAWFRLTDDALTRLTEVAHSRENGRVSLPDSRVIAEELLEDDAHEEIVRQLTLTTLNYGLGKGVWEMRFFREDDTEIPQEEAWGRIREHTESGSDESWQFGVETIVSWVLF